MGIISNGLYKFNEIITAPGNRITDLNMAENNPTLNQHETGKVNAYQKTGHTKNSGGNKQQAGELNKLPAAANVDSIFSDLSHPFVLSDNNIEKNNNNWPEL